MIFVSYKLYICRKSLNTCGTATVSTWYICTTAHIGLFDTEKWTKINIHLLNESLVNIYLRVSYSNIWFVISNLENSVRQIFRANPFLKNSSVIVDLWFEFKNYIIMIQNDLSNYRISLLIDALIHISYIAWEFNLELWYLQKVKE